MRTRGLTLIELLISLAVLTAVVASASVLIHSASRKQKHLWDEFVAREIAMSVLESVQANAKCDPTPEGGMVVSTDKLLHAQVAPVTLAGGEPLSKFSLDQMEVRLTVTPVPETPGIMEARATVTWLSDSAKKMSVEYTLLRRAAQ